MEVHNMVESGVLTHLRDTVTEHAIPLTGAADDYAPLLEMIGDAPLVMIGEATHGTQEFYQQRAEITKLLICQKGFNAVAAEADWPDAYRINQYVRGRQGANNIARTLSHFKRFPGWMWRNNVVAEFAQWLQSYNQDQADERDEVGFYGLDLYSMNSSADTVITILEDIDPEAAQRARVRYGCFDNFRDNLNDYGFASAFGIARSCEDEIVEELLEIREMAFQRMQHASDEQAELLFNLEQNARLVKNAEHYYRSLFSSHADSWNLRDQHMFETLEVLFEYFNAKQEAPAKIVVWAHNSHIGDASATEYREREQFNIGQLGRQHYKNDAVLVGFSTYTGTVTAASHWDTPGHRKLVRPALPGSCEDLLHSMGDSKDFYLLLRDNKQLKHYFDIHMLQRAIGVVYIPETERISHYFYARLAEQFDAIIHIDHTSAIEALE
jgi:erythromycin esterase-like protein